MNLKKVHDYNKLMIKKYNVPFLKALSYLLFIIVYNFFELFNLVLKTKKCFEKEL